MENPLNAKIESFFLPTCVRGRSWRIELEKALTENQAKWKLLNQSECCAWSSNYDVLAQKDGAYYVCSGCIKEIWTSYPALQVLPTHPDPGCPTAPKHDEYNRYGSTYTTKLTK